MLDELSKRLGLAYLASQQAQKHVVLNESLTKLDAIVLLRLESRALSSPPLSAQDGTAFLVKSPAGGAWFGHDGEIARADGEGWIFITPQIGWLAYDAELDGILVLGQAGWHELQGAGAPASASGFRFLNIIFDFGVNGSRVQKAIFPVTGVKPGQKIMISTDGDAADAVEMDMAIAAAHIIAEDRISIIAHSLSGPISGPRSFTLMLETGV